MNERLLDMSPFFIANKGEHSTKTALMLTQAGEKFVVRLTGGCGYMSGDDAEGLYDLFVSAFKLVNFSGALLFGGTRMLLRSYPDIAYPGITEIAPLVKEACPNVRTLGIVPRTQDLKLSGPHGIIVGDDAKDEYFTIVHPHQDHFMLVQRSVDEAATWDDEWEECMKIIGDLRDYSEWKSLLICYNGGGVTERELLAHAERQWPVLLINGSGRTTERYANDEAFLSLHPNVFVADKSSATIAEMIESARKGENRKQGSVFADGNNADHSSKNPT